MGNFENKEEIKGLVYLINFLLIEIFQREIENDLLIFNLLTDKNENIEKFLIENTKKERKIHQITQAILRMKLDKYRKEEKRNKYIYKIPFIKIKKTTKMKECFDLIFEESKKLKEFHLVYKI